MARNVGSRYDLMNREQMDARLQEVAATFARGYEKWRAEQEQRHAELGAVVADVLRLHDELRASVDGSVVGVMERTVQMIGPLEAYVKQETARQFRQSWRGRVWAARERWVALWTRRRSRAAV